MRFEFVTLFNEPELPKRPVYVHEGKIGIVQSSVEAVVSKLPARGKLSWYVLCNDHNNNINT